MEYLEGRGKLSLQAIGLSNMKVGFLTDGQTGGGIPNFAKELSESISQFEAVDLKPISPSGPNIEIPIFTSYVLTPRKIRKTLRNVDEDVDILHLPSQFDAAALIGYDLPVPVIVTVHDLIPVVTNYGNMFLSHYTERVLRGLESADSIVSISNHTKMDILDSTNISEETVHTIYPSIDKDKYTKAAPLDALAEFEIERPYLLYVGTQAPRKNLEVIFRALDRLPDEFSVVLAGSPGNPIQKFRIKRQIKRYGVVEKVKLTGHVSIEMLSRLYQSAFAFTFPSKYEGFGRPPLEAMSVGTPVICANTTSIPEVVGDAAILCDPDDEHEWIEAVRSLFANKAEYDNLSEAGRRQAKSFSWEQTAQKTIELYDEIVEGY
ncbi:glycosyltransferase family 4 protein [Halorhabdus utahensis]|nr:glycosyltransferase family 1 protein [Halorhabdus utahensis]